MAHRRETSGKTSGRVSVPNTPLAEGSSPDVISTLPYQPHFVAGALGRTPRHQSGPLPPVLDAPQRSPAPEPWRRHPWPGRLRTLRCSRAACLGRTRVWSLEYSGAADGLAASGPARWALAAPPARGLSSGRV